MTNRQARTERRAAERKAKKAEIRRLKADGLPLLPSVAPHADFDEEFSPELLAEARAARERVRQRIQSMEAPPPPAVSKRAEINRANAQHSTGPTSTAGKFASSRNSLKHGLASGALIIPGEDPAAFESLLDDLMKEQQPANPTEELLIHEMAQSWWLTQRALRLQNECFTESGIDEKRLALFLRYQTTHDRAFHKALNTLIRLRKERTRATRGFVSQSTADPLPNDGFVSQRGEKPVYSPDLEPQKSTAAPSAQAA